MAFLICAAGGYSDGDISWPGGQSRGEAVARSKAEIVKCQVKESGVKIRCADIHKLQTERLESLPSEAEGSAHKGPLHNEYDSSDLCDANGNVAQFDMDSPYYSQHGGVGYVWNMAEGLFP